MFAIDATFSLKRREGEARGDPSFSHAVMGKDGLRYFVTSEIWAAKVKEKEKRGKKRKRNDRYFFLSGFLVARDSISMDQIIKLATKAIGMEWEVLAYLLGFTRPEVDRFQLDYPNKVSPLGC